MKLKIIPLIFMLFIAKYPLHALNADVMGTMKGNFTYNEINDEYYMKKFLFPDTNKYFLNNYVFLNGRIKFTNTGTTFGIIDLDVQIDGMYLKQTNIITQNVAFQLNEGYAGVKLQDNLVFNIGKKRVVWGVAYSRNPSDFINPPKNPFDPEAEKRGVFLADAEWFSPYFSFNPVIVVYDQLDYFGYGGRIATSALIPSTDLNGIVYYSKDNKINLGFSIASTPFSEVDALADLALHFESGFVQKSLRKPDKDNEGYYTRCITGFNYFVPFTQSYITGEYAYQEDGYTSDDLKNIADFKTNGITDPGNMGAHNLVVSFNQPTMTSRVSRITDTLSLTGVVLYNIVDSSYFMSGTVGSGYVDNCLFTLEYGTSAGNKGSEFSFLPMKSYIKFETKIGF